MISAVSTYAQKELNTVSAVSQAKIYLKENKSRFLLTETEIDQLKLSRTGYSKKSGVTHLYFSQTLNNIEIYNAIIDVHLDRNNRIIKAGDRSVKFKKSTNEIASRSTISMQDAIDLAAKEMGITSLSRSLESTNDHFRSIPGYKDATIFENSSVSIEPIAVRLMYVMKDAGVMKLVWDFSLFPEGRKEKWNYHVDATSGEIVSKISMVRECTFGHDHEGDSKEDIQSHICHNAGEAGAYEEGTDGASYNVFAVPFESPYSGPRSIVTNPADDIASPFGWHDTNGAAGAEYTITRGNNAYAYFDAVAPNGPDANSSPDGGPTLNFDFPLDLTLAPSSYRPAAVTNMFYMTNIMHDWAHKYGFDEANSNFQTNNYGNGGIGGDPMNAEAQDYSELNNARYFHSVEGTSSRIQMYLWNLSTPNRDGDFDNGVIGHEYGHGISIRLTGNGNTCLNNEEEMGEGWSDYFGYMNTWVAGTNLTSSRGVGTYVLNQAPNGLGIRTKKYSYDFAVNNFTYNSIKTQVAPHGVGSVWATMLWDMTLKLIEAHGEAEGLDISANIVMEGLKLQPCSPGFVDGRDAILLADQMLYGGANSCIIWDAFARRGLGFYANQGTSQAKSDGVEDFQTPLSVGVVLPDFTNVSITESSITLGGGLHPGGIYSGPGVTDHGNGTTFTFDPLVAGVGIHTITYTVGSTLCLSAGMATAQIEVEAGGTLMCQGDISSCISGVISYSPPTFTSERLLNAENFDGVQAPALPFGWSTTSDYAASNPWVTTTSQNNSSPNSAFATDNINLSVNSLTSIGYNIGSNSELKFKLHYNLEPSAANKAFDGLVLEYKTNQDNAWQDITQGGTFTAGAYNREFENNNPLGVRACWSGNSSTFIDVIVALNASLAGNTVRFRWRLSTDLNTNVSGAKVDDIVVTDLQYNTQIVQTEGLSSGSIFPVGVTTNTFEVAPVPGYSISCSFNVIVAPPFVVTATASPNPICSGTTLNLDVTPGSSYNWSGPNNFSSQLKSPSIANIQTAGNGLYVVTVTNADGCAGTASINVIVNPIPATPIITAAGQTTFCAGGSLLLTSSAPSGNQWYMNGMPIGGATGQTYVATASGAYAVVITSGGCTSALSASIVVTVSPVPDVNQPADQVLCNDASTTAINFTGSLPNTVFDWTNNTPSIGLAASGTGDIASFTAINTTNAPVVATVSVTPSNIGGGIAYVTNFSGNSVSVVKTATNEIIATIPVGAAPVAVAFNPDGSRAYIANFSSGNVSVINTASHSVIATIPVGGSPDALVVLPDGSKLYVCNQFDNTISVINTATNNIITTINVGSSPSGIIASPDGSLVYVSNQLSSNVSVINTATDLLSSNISVGQGPVGIARNPAGTRLYVGNTNSNNVSVINTATGSVIATVAVGIQPVAIASNPDGLKIYVANLGSNDVSVINTTTNSTITTIPVGAGPAGISISADGSRAFTTNSAQNSVSVIDILTNSVITTITGFETPYTWGNFISPLENETCVGATKTFTFTVNPKPSLSASPQTICSGASTSISLFPNVTGTTFTWTAMVLNAPNGGTITGFSNCNSSCGSAISQVLVNTGTSLGVVRYTVIPTANGCVGDAVVVDVAVDVCCPTIPTLTTNPTPAVCSGNNVILTASGLTTMNANSYGITFKYFSAATSDPYTGGTVIATVPNGSLTGGGTIATTTTSTLPPGNNFVYAILSPTPTDVNCRPSATANITVNPIPVVTTPATATICNGTATNIALTASTDPGTTFTWTIGTITGVTGATACAVACGTTIAQTLTNTGSVPGTVQYIVTPLSSLGCAGTPYTITVTVNPTPTAVASPSSQTICSAASISTIVLSGDVGATTYNWTRDNNAAVTGIAASGSGNISGSLTNTTSAPITVTFTITPSANGCTGTPVTATVLVNPTPNAIATPASQTICSATAITTIALTGAVSGTTYAWTRNNTATVNGIAASGSGNISGTLTNTTSAPLTVTFTITPSANGCSGAPITATVVVNPTPIASATPSSQGICSGKAIMPITLSSAASGTTFTWTRNNTATVTGIAASGSGNISGTLTNITLAPVTVTFTITPSANGCVGAPITATVTVNPTPVGTISISPNPGCVGSTIQFSATGGSSYSWSGPQGYTSTLQNPSILLVNHLQGGTYTVTITSAAGCFVVKSATLIVNYPPIATATYEVSTACVGSNLQLHAAGAGSYTWTGPAGFTSNLKDPKINNVTAANSGLYTLVVTSPNGCTATTTINITINTPPALSANPSITQTCEGSRIQLFATGTGSFVWTGPATYTSTDQNPVIQNIPIHLSGIYTVNLTAATGCISTASVEVKVYDQITAIATATPDTVCEGQSVHLHAEGGSKYLWVGPNGYQSEESDPRIDNITLARAGKYFVYIYNDGGCFGYDEVNVVVRPAAKGTAYASPNPVTEFSQVQLFASNTGVAYSWTGPNGFTSNVQNPIIKKVTRAMSGVYVVTIINENGCPTLVRVNLRVIFTNKGGQTFTDNDDQLSTRTEKAGTVYPNPTNDILYFREESSAAIEYIIYDANGKIQTTLRTTSDRYISTSAIANGVYQIRWKPQDGNEWRTSKFVKIQ